MVAHNSPIKEGPHLVSREDNFITKSCQKPWKLLEGKGRPSCPIAFSAELAVLLLAPTLEKATTRPSKNDYLSRSKCPLQLSVTLY